MVFFRLHFDTASVDKWLVRVDKISYFLPVLLFLRLASTQCLVSIQHASLALVGKLPRSFIVYSGCFETEALRVCAKVAHSIPNEAHFAALH
jgi:hypothetical protein